MIKFHCPHCHEELQIPDQYAGQSGGCNKCGGRIQVPALVGDAPASPPSEQDDLAAAIEASMSRTRPQPVVAKPTLADRVVPMAKPLGMVVGVIAVVALVAFGIANLPKSVSSPRIPSPEDTARSFMDGAKSGSAEACKPYLTAASQQNFELMLPGFQFFDDFTVGVGSSSQTEATVPVHLTQFGMTTANDLLLKMDGGYWRVYALRMKPMPEMSMTMNFENPEAILGELENMMMQMPPEVRQQMENAMQQQGGF